MLTSTIEKVEEFKEQIANKQPNVELVPLDFSLLTFNEENKTIKYGEYSIDNKPTNKIYDLLGIRNDLPKKMKRYSENDWNVIQNTLKKLGNKQGYFAEFNKNNNKIQAIRNYNDAKNTDEQTIENLNFIDHILNNMRITDLDLEIANLNYDPNNNLIKMDFINKDSEFEALPNWKGIQDSWKTGFSIEKDSFQSKFNSFFYRLVCTNGMTTKELGNSSSIKNDLDNYEKRIGKEINKLFMGYDSDIVKSIQEKCKYLSLNNLSVKEYAGLFQKLSNLNTDEEYQNLINQKFIHFDRIADFYEFKGYELKNQSNTWLKTANSGLNAYEVFNQMTEISSHPTTYEQLNQKDANQIQMWSQGLFFNPLDLTQVAEKFQPIFN